MKRPPARKPLLMWAGMSDGEVHVFVDRDAYGAYKRPALFATRNDARREYQHVERVRVSVVGKR